MRIISGKARGTKLYTLNGNNTRPTLDRAKEALFNIIGNGIIKSNFLDLFGGSGAIGLEAASRGAKSVIISDKSKQAIEIIKKNTIKTHLEEVVNVYNLDFKECLNKIKDKQDYIFLDPPYESKLLIESLELIIKKDLLEKEGTIILETDCAKTVENQLKNLNIETIDKRKYGRIEFIFLKMPEGNN